MTDDQIYHVKLQENRTGWLWSILIIVMVVFWGWFTLRLNTDLIGDNTPYLVDLNEEQHPATIDYQTRYELVVRVETPNGVELRFYEAKSGKLLGTFIEQSSTDL